MTTEFVELGSVDAFRVTEPMTLFVDPLITERLLTAGKSWKFAVKMSPFALSKTSAVV